MNGGVEVLQWSGTPFSLTSEEVPQEPGHWSHCRVFIHMDGEVIGEYSYDRPSHHPRLFCPFRWDEEWFALFAPGYTELAVMRLPSCEVIPTSFLENCTGDLCPLEVWVPRYQERSQNRAPGDYLSRRYENEILLQPYRDEAGDLLPYQYADFAVVETIYWALEREPHVWLLDLSSLTTDGRLKAIGRWDMPNNLRVQQFVYFEGGSDKFEIAVRKSHSLDALKAEPLPDVYDDWSGPKYF